MNQERWIQKKTNKRPLQGGKRKGNVVYWSCQKPLDQLEAAKRGLGEKVTVHQIRKPEKVLILLEVLQSWSIFSPWPQTAGYVQSHFLKSLFGAFLWLQSSVDLLLDLPKQTDHSTNCNVRQKHPKKDHKQRRQAQGQTPRLICGASSSDLSSFTSQ